MASRFHLPKAPKLLALTLLLFSPHTPGQEAERARLVAITHYSPFEDLERLDHEQIARAQHTLDIAMYSFTDLYLANDLKELATRYHVHIRIYRDREQFFSEQHAADGRMRHSRYISTTDFLHSTPNIEIRVKANSIRNLMHLKAYVVDHALFRDGSANWSPTGLKDQDNKSPLHR